jgi:hypothetical protein
MDNRVSDRRCILGFRANTTPLHCSAGHGHCRTRQGSAHLHQQPQRCQTGARASVRGDRKPASPLRQALFAQAGVLGGPAAATGNVLSTRHRCRALQQGVDVAVFILWTRLGTPLGALIRKSDGSPYRSGTEREYDLMLQARALTRETEGVARPSLLVYTHRDDASFAETLRNARSSQELAAQQPADDAHALLTEFEIAPPPGRAISSLCLTIANWRSSAASPDCSKAMSRNCPPSFSHKSTARGCY